MVVVTVVASEAVVVVVLEDEVAETEGVGAADVEVGVEGLETAGVEEEVDSGGGEVEIEGEEEVCELG